MRRFIDKYELSPASLKFFRIGLGLAVIFNLLQRIRGVPLFYLESGVLPGSLYLERVFWWESWSIHWLTGQNEVLQYAMFALHAATALGIIFGYRTRFCIALCWVLTVSLHHRNPFVLTVGDWYLRLMLFWAFFLERNPFAGLGWLFQICCIYFFSALLKLQNIAWTEGSALRYIWYSMGSDWVAPEWLVTLATYSGLGIELIAPLLLLLGFSWPRLRWAVLGVLALFHVGIAATMGLVYISAIALIALLPFLPLGSRSNLSQNRSWKTAAIPLAAMALILAGNLGSNRVATFFGLNQGWRMYAVPNTERFRFTVEDEVGTNHLGPWLGKPSPWENYLRELPKPENTYLVGRFLDWHCQNLPTRPKNLRYEVNDRTIMRKECAQ